MIEGMLINESFFFLVLLFTVFLLLQAIYILKCSHFYFWDSIPGSVHFLLLLTSSSDSLLLSIPCESTLFITLFS